MSIKRILIILLIVSLIFSVFPEGTEGATGTKLKGICLHGEDIVKEGVESVVNKLSNFGYNAVFLLVKTPEGKVFYKSPTIPNINDILGQLIEYAHRKSIKVYVYFPVAMDKNYASKNPSERMISSAGVKDANYVSLTSNNYIDYIKQFLSEVLQYDIDGVTLDYIRYPNGNFDFTPAFMEFARNEGVNVEKVKEIAYRTFVKPADWKSMFVAYEEGDADVVKWVFLRNNVIRNTISVLRNHIKSIKPSIPVGAFTVSRGYRFDYIKEAPKVSATFSYQIVNFSQHPSTLKGLLDFINPMIYLSNLEEDSSYVEIATAKIRSIMGEDFPIYVALNPYNVSAEENAKSIYNGYRGSSGVVVFRYPLFTVGNILFEDGELKKIPAKYSITTSKGEKVELNFNQTRSPFMPSYKDAIFISHYYKSFQLELSIGNKQYIVNDETFEMDVAPFIQDSRTFVPVRFIAQGLGAMVSWEGEERVVNIYRFIRLD